MVPLGYHEFGRFQSWEEGDSVFLGEEMIFINGFLRIPDLRARYEIDFQDPNIRKLGATPFDNPLTLQKLIEAMQFLARGSSTPLQIEGAFSALDPTMPVLYQMIEVPSVPAEFGPPIDLANADFFSENVIGSANFRGPILFLSEDSPSYLQSLYETDGRFAGTGYALVTNYHGSDIIFHSPNCLIRLSCEIENFGAHAPTLIRIELARNPHSGRVLASGLSGSVPHAHSYGPVTDIRVFQGRVRSNGRVLRLDLDPPANQ